MSCRGKNIFVYTILFYIVLNLLGGVGILNTTVYATDIPNIDTQSLDKGIVGVNFLNTSDRRIKVIIDKGNDKYIYDLDADGHTHYYPLQMGEGIYKIGILEQVEGKRYKYLTKKTIEYKHKNSLDVYLNSIETIKWDGSFQAIEVAQSLVDGIEQEEQKVRVIYEFILNNFEYDDKKIYDVDTTYKPDIEKLYSEGKGMCYDFSSIFAAMLRSVGIPSKLVKGYGKGIAGYHAWNEVYIDNRWHVIDISTDVQIKAKGRQYTMYKSAKDYTKTREY